MNRAVNTSLDKKAHPPQRNIRTFNSRLNQISPLLQQEWTSRSSFGWQVPPYSNRPGASRSSPRQYTVHGKHRIQGDQNKTRVGIFWATLESAQTMAVSDSNRRIICNIQKLRENRGNTLKIMVDTGPSSLTFWSLGDTRDNKIELPVLRWRHFRVPGWTRKRRLWGGVPGTEWVVTWGAVELTTGRREATSSLTEVNLDSSEARWEDRVLERSERSSFKRETSWDK